jgi:hypothetical protein
VTVCLVLHQIRKLKEPLVLPLTFGSKLNGVKRTAFTTLNLTEVMSPLGSKNETYPLAFLPSARIALENSIPVTHGALTEYPIALIVNGTLTWNLPAM